MNIVRPLLVLALVSSPALAQGTGAHAPKGDQANFSQPKYSKRVVTPDGAAKAALQNVRPGSKTSPAKADWGTKGDWGTHDQKNNFYLPSGNPYVSEGPNPGPLHSATETGVAAGPVGSNPGGVAGGAVRSTSPSPQNSSRKGH